MRILFLDDDPIRAAAFAAGCPLAVWVQTAEQCRELLEEAWDEVHLDHDLGGEAFVDQDRDDCGMAVVRWLCEQPHAHLAGTRFVIHSHNDNAACIMALHLEVMGYRVQVQPFGRQSASPLPDRAALPARGTQWKRKIVDWLVGKKAARKIL